MYWHCCSITVALFNVCQLHLGHNVNVCLQFCQSIDTCVPMWYHGVVLESVRWPVLREAASDLASARQSDKAVCGTALGQVLSDSWSPSHQCHTRDLVTSCSTTLATQISGPVSPDTRPLHSKVLNRCRTLDTTQSHHYHNSWILPKIAQDCNWLSVQKRKFFQVENPHQIVGEL